MIGAGTEFRRLVVLAHCDYKGLLFGDRFITQVFQLGIYCVQFPFQPGFLMRQGVFI